MIALVIFRDSQKINDFEKKELAQKGHIWLTEFWQVDGKYGGDIIAGSYEAAQLIAQERSIGEIIIGKFMGEFKGPEFSDAKANDLLLTLQQKDRAILH